MYLLPQQSHISPVALPRVANVHVMDAMSVGLLIQEVEHVFNCEGQGSAPAHSAEQSLKEVVHKLLQCALKNNRKESSVLFCPL